MKPIVLLHIVLITCPLVVLQSYPPIPQFEASTCVFQFTLMPSVSNAFNNKLVHGVDARNIGSNPRVISSRDGLNSIGNGTLLEDSYRDFPKFITRFYYLTMLQDLTPLLKIINASKLSYSENAWFVGLIVSAGPPFGVREAFVGPIFTYRHPRVALIWQEPFRRTWSWMVMCYLCQVDQPWNHGFQDDNITFERLVYKYHTMNNQAYGSPVEAPLGKYWNSDYKDSNAFKSWKYGTTLSVMRHCLLDRFNFSIPDPQIIQQGPRLRINIPNKYLIPGWRSSNHMQNILAFEVRYSMFYCRSFITFEEHPLIFFLRPFDLPTWLCLLVLIVMTGAVAKKMWFALDIIWTLLSIRMQGKYSKIIFISLSVLIIAQQHYIALFTSLVLAPMPPARIKTNRELFREFGFKVVRHSRFNVKVLDDRAKYFEKYVDPSFFNSYFVNDTIVCNTEWIQDDCLSDWADVGTTFIETKFTSKSIANIARVAPQLFCATVEEPLPGSTWITMELEGYLQKAVYNFLSNLVASGITNFWDNLFVTGSKREAKVSTTWENFVFKALALSNKSLISLFKMCAVLIVLSIFVFILEILYFIYGVSLHELLVKAFIFSKHIHPNKSLVNRPN